MSGRKFRALTAGLLLLATAALAQAYRPYHNARYGTRVDIPAEFRARPAPQNNDGRTFVSPDGRGQIAVFGSHGPSVATGTFEEYRDWMAEQEEEQSRVTYRAGGAGWFVLSGANQGGIFYLKVIAGCKDQSIGHHVRIMYPPAQKQAYDAIVRRVAASLAFTASDECGDESEDPASAPPPAEPARAMRRNSMLIRRRDEDQGANPRLNV